ncbi:MAG TPA: pirin family protein [Polyangia bacterium]
MTIHPANDPKSEATAPRVEPGDDVVDLAIAGRPRPLGGGFEVRRLLPSPARRMVGPFIFVDHFGPVQLAQGNGLDVRPHPHINLATVTYLFEGEILHRDSLGSEQLIRPGAVNWMTAGRGIVHSERSPSEARATGPRLHGLQLWVALPQAHEEDAPAFHHHDARSIPEVSIGNVFIRVVAGTAYGATSPVAVHSPLFYVEARIPAGARLPLPDHPQRAAYVVEGTIACGGELRAAGTMLVLREGATGEIEAKSDAVVMLLGGDALDGERYIDWNFVSSSRERIERAKQLWRERAFPVVPGDEIEFIPL